MRVEGDHLVFQRGITLISSEETETESRSGSLRRPQERLKEGVRESSAKDRLLQASGQLVLVSEGQRRDLGLRESRSVSRVGGERGVRESH